MQRPRSRLLASADRSDGSFTLAPPLLQTLAGGALADGTHALHLEATDKAGDLSRLDLSFIRDTTAATMSGRLAHDTGASGSDRLTNDPKVAGTITDANGIAKFGGALDRGASRAVTSALQPEGSFTLTPALLKTLAGGALRDGAHTPHLVATDKAGKTSSLDLSFVLDTKIAPPSFDITPASDSAKTGNRATTVIPVALQGSTDPNAQVTLVGKGLIADAAGDF
jgi:Bacterial Ig-like domain